MSGNSKPFRRVCVRCGDLFAAPRSRDVRCCQGCFEELDEARQDLQHSKTRLRSLREKVESLQEALRRHKDRIDPKLEKVRALGTRWANAQNVQEREAIEQRERRLQSSLSGLIEVAHEVNERSRSAEKEKHELEDELINLLKIVGDDTSLYDQF